MANRRQIIADGIILETVFDRFIMNELFATPNPEEEQLPMILAIALNIAKLSFPKLIYTGKIVSDSDDIDDCELCLFARDIQGAPLPEDAISLEILKVGKDRSITAEYPEQESIPILWYGQHALWMDGETGQTVGAPLEGIGLERLARGIIKKLEEIDP